MTNIKNSLVNIEEVKIDHAFCMGLVCGSLATLLVANLVNQTESDQPENIQPQY